MNLPDRIRIEYDGALHPYAAARVVDLDTGQEVPHILEVRVVIAKGSLVAYLDFFDMQGAKELLGDTTITRAYAMPELDMRHTRAAPPETPANEG